ncbi:hypothetical protein EMCRGX_G032106 [Ephydatia muelleri]
MTASALALILFLTAVVAARKCNPWCSLGLVETIPQNLTYKSGSPTYPSTYDAWLRLLDSAQESVSIASFYWTLRDNDSDPTDQEGMNIFNKLVETGKRGVKIQVVQNVPSHDYPDTDTVDLAAMGVAEVLSLNVSELFPGGGILHTKLWVVDGRHFYMGSANMDWRSLTQVKEMGVLGMDCECLAGDAYGLFQVYWYLAKTCHVPLHWNGTFSAEYNMKYPAEVLINGTDATAFWASAPPEFCTEDRTSDIDALEKIIYSATKFIYIAVMDYFPALIYTPNSSYWSRIDTAIRTMAYNGVHVRLMGSCWNNTSPDMDKFLSSLSTISGTNKGKALLETRFFVVPQLHDRSIPFARVNHNKYMVTDNAAYIGTSNWSGDYFVTTGGVSLSINQTLTSSNLTVQVQLQEVFERDWFSQYTTEHCTPPVDNGVH